MIDIKPALARFGIDSKSLIKAMQDVRIHAEAGTQPERIGRLNDLMKQVFGFGIETVEVNGTLVIEHFEIAITYVQAAFEHAIRNNGLFEIEQSVLDAAHARTQKFLSNPAHKWMFAEPEATVTATNLTAVVEGIDVKVAVKADGKIKKGGKQVLAMELYKKHVVTAATPMDNKQFVEVLMKELGMTKSGATTYAYNCRKEAK